MRRSILPSLHVAVPRHAASIAVLLATCVGASTAVAQDAAFERRARELADEVVLFDPGDAVVEDEQASVVIDHVQLAQDFAGDRLKLEGRRDASEDSPPQRDLGLRRARDVLRHLVQMGLDPRRIDIVDLGATAPRVHCDEAPCRAKNRSVVITHALK
ncbi:MAG TPA: OmpA family protein [Burkholderiaceae bacterium]|nr:OmpA family protein [Burkholderiaceae bacterium]